jgi:hypothetical protein
LALPTGNILKELRGLQNPLDVARHSEMMSPTHSEMMSPACSEMMSPRVP